LDCEFIFSLLYRRNVNKESKKNIIFNKAKKNDLLFSMIEEIKEKFYIFWSVVSLGYQIQLILKFFIFVA